MRNRIFGAIGVIWGGAILISRLLKGSMVEGSGAYAGGQLVSLIFAVLLFGVGLYYLIKGGGKPKQDGPPAA